jgi:large subunit ribosomal protein L18
MRLSQTYTLPFKRKSAGKTDYKKRLRLLESRKPRLVVRRSLQFIQAQIISYEKGGDKTLASSTSKSFKKLGWNFACDNTSAAYLVGFAIGKVALRNNIQEAILDSGLYRSTKGNRIYAVVKGARDAGLNIPVGEEMLPSEDRVMGKHTQNKDLPSKLEEIKQKLEKG